MKILKEKDLKTLDKIQQNVMFPVKAYNAAASRLHC